MFSYGHYSVVIRTAQMIEEPPEIWLGHTPEFAEKNRKAAEETVRELGFNEIHWIECGTVITTHGGTGCFGLSGFGKKTSKGRNKM